MAISYVDLSLPGVGGAGTLADPYTYDDLSNILNPLTSLTEDVTFKLFNTKILSSGEHVDWTTPLLLVDNGYSITFEYEPLRDPPKIYSEAGGYTQRGLLRIGGGTAQINLTDLIVQVRGNLNRKLQGCIEVIGSNKVIIANDGLIGNALYNFASSGGCLNTCFPGCNPVGNTTCFPGCFPGCSGGCNMGYEAGFTPVIAMNNNVYEYSCTEVVHSADERLMENPPMLSLNSFTNCLVILGNVAYTYYVKTNPATYAEGNYFFKVEDTNVSVIDNYATSVLAPESKPDVGDYTQVHGLKNVVGDENTLDLEYDPEAGIGKGLFSIADTTTFDDNYELFSTFTNQCGHAGYVLSCVIVPVSVTEPNLITVLEKSLKYSSKFTCIGWVKDLHFTASDRLIPLAVSDSTGSVLGSGSALAFDILRDGADYRLSFSGSKSKLIRSAVGININDGEWHFLGYLCDDDGTMSYVVDDYSVDPEDGVADDGISFTKARSLDIRQGGGDVWSPYLFDAGQSVSGYNWRFAAGFRLTENWVNELMQVDRKVLF